MRGHRYNPYAGSGINWREILMFGVPFGRVFAIQIRLHIILILFFLFELLQSMGSMAQFILGGIGFSLILFGSVLLHELGHCYGAHIVRGRASQIVLWPLGGMAMVEGANKSPYAELLVTALGPAVSLLLFLGAWIFELLLPDPTFASSAGLFYLHVLLLMTWQINLMLFLFNMLVPIFPMDCGRLVRACVALRIPPRRATSIVCYIGIWVAAFGIFASLFIRGDVEALRWIPVGPIFTLICILGIFTCLQELAMVNAGYPVYEGYQSYGGRFFYTGTPDEWRPFRPLESVSGAGRKLKGLFKRRKRDGGPARVVALDRAARPSEPETPRARYLHRLRELEDELKSAVQREDFKRAGQIKKQVEELKRQHGGAKSKAT